MSRTFSFLERAEAWVASTVVRVYAVLDNLSAHRATDVLFFSLAHPRWAFVFQPVYAAYLNLIEPWWKVLRSRSGADASRAGPTSSGRSPGPPRTGTRTGIRSCGAADGDTGRIASPA